MGQTTPNIGIFIPAPGETNYDQPFAAGMVNIDQHDHSGAPNKGVPIATGGLADFSVTYNKLNANVVDTTTGIGVSGALPNQLQMLGILKNIYQLATATGFLAKNGSNVAARTFQNSSSITWTNADGSGGNPSASLAANSVNPTQCAFLAYISAGMPQNGVTGMGTVYQVKFDTVDFDQSSNYSTITNSFTAPVSGVYNFGINLRITNTSSSQTTCQVDIYLNGSLEYTLFYQNTTGGVGIDVRGISAPQLLKLSASDVVSVFLTVSGGGSDSVNITAGNFTGVLLC